VLGLVADTAAPAAWPAEAEGLRRAAEAGLAREQAEEASRVEARRRAADSATAMRGDAERSRRAAETAAAARHQTTLWNSAEAKFSEGLSALAGEAYAQGERHLLEARQLYERAEAGAREAQAAAAATALQTARIEQAKTGPVARGAFADTSDETVFVDTGSLLAERRPTAPIDEPVAASPAAPTQATPVPVTARTFSAPPTVEVERPRSTPFAPPSYTPPISGRSRLSALPKRSLTLAAVGGVSLALIAGVVVWLSSGRDTGRDRWESVAQLRTTVVAARDRATKAEAPALAAEPFSKAEAAQGDGERLSNASDLAGATQAYQTAVDRYGEAERQAQARQAQRAEADAARTRMAAEKLRATPDAADYARAAELERQGGALYTRQSFTEAGASFKAAGELFAKALPPSAPPSAPATRPPAATPAPVAPAPVPPAPIDAKTQIRTLLDSWVRATETKDVELLRRVRPSLSNDELVRVRQMNGIKRSHKVDLRIYDIALAGAEAQAQGRREDVIVLMSGQRIQTEAKVTFALKQGPRGWVISEIRESADRPPAESRPPARAPRRSDAVPR
jgi:hypothetical protein